MMAGPGLLLYCCSAILSVSHSPPWCAAPFVKILPVFHTASYAQIKTGGSSAMRKKGRTVLEDTVWNVLLLSPVKSHLTVPSYSLTPSGLLVWTTWFCPELIDVPMFYNIDVFALPLELYSAFPKDQKWGLTTYRIYLYLYSFPIHHRIMETTQWESWENLLKGKSALQILWIIKLPNV